MPELLEPVAERVLGCYTLDAAVLTDANRSRIQLFPGPGDYVHPRSGKFTISAADLEAWRDDLNARGNDISVDYDHSFAMGAGSLAAGWFVSGTATIENGGLYADVEWTTEAAADIKAKRYRFISPEFAFTFKTQQGQTVRKPRLYAAALTNRPFFSQMQPVMVADTGLAELLGGARYVTSDEYELLARVADEPQREVLFASLQSFDPQTRERTLAYLNTLGAGGAPDKESTMPDLKGLAESVGLTADASDDDILAALTAKAAKTDELETKVTALEAQVPKDGAMAALIASAKRGEDAATELAVMKRDTCIASAITDFRIMPAEKETYEGFWAIDPEGTQKLLEAKAPLPIRSSGNSSARTVVTHNGELDVIAGTTVPATMTVNGDTIPVGDTSAQIHTKALELLAAAGKGESYTADEYVAASTRACGELGLSFLGAQHVDRS